MATSARCYGDTPERDLTLVTSKECHILQHSYCGYMSPFEAYRSMVNIIDKFHFKFFFLMDMKMIGRCCHAFSINSHPPSTPACLQVSNSASGLSFDTVRMVDD
mmetsp:Transcript_28229/g.44036  ORF Transcript_28229/g.44036 Transcript_28229/m.44036 type:complete len:104 (+) Transcript_28229:976-1287(+)